MKVLHDYDGAFPEFEKECRAYLDTLIQLDRLAGVEPIIGIKSTVYDVFPDIEKKLRDRYGELDIRIHVHVIEDFKNENRSRHWIPALNVDKRLWRYDSEFVQKDNLILLKKGEIPNFHVDHPDYLSKYIEWLYRIKFEEMNIYEV